MQKTIILTIIVLTVIPYTLSCDTDSDCSDDEWCNDEDECVPNPFKDLGYCLLLFCIFFWFYAIIGVIYCYLVYVENKKKKKKIKERLKRMGYSRNGQQ